MRKIKKNIGFFLKWFCNKGRKEILDITASEAYKQIEKQRTHRYKLTEVSNAEFKEECGLSIIIPAYNAELYLAQAVESALKAAESIDKEIIIIDDGSTDQTAIIARGYADQYGEVSFYTKNNGGMSSARNYGLVKARGRFLYFLDSDDIVLELAPLYHAACTYDLDVTEGNFGIFSNECELNNLKKHIKGPGKGCRDISGDYKSLSKSSGFVWGKLFKKKVWDKIYFPEGFVFEDAIVPAVIMRRCKKYMFLDILVQGYRKNLKSICYTVNETPQSFDSYLVYRYIVDNEDKLIPKDCILFRQMLHQFGSMTYSRIKNHSDYDKRCSFVIMCNMIMNYGNLYKNQLGFYERILLNSFLKVDYALWIFLCEYCFV